MSDEKFTPMELAQPIPKSSLVGESIYDVEDPEYGLTSLSNGLWFKENNQPVKLWRLGVLFGLVISCLFLFFLLSSVGAAPLFFLLFFIIPISLRLSGDSSKWAKRGLVLFEDELRWSVGFHRISLYRDDVIGLDLEKHALSILFRRGAKLELGTLRITDQLRIPIQDLMARIHEWRQEKNATPQEREDTLRDQAWAHRVYKLHQIRHWLPSKVSRSIVLGSQNTAAQQQLLLSIKPYEGRIAFAHFVVRWLRNIVPIGTILAALLALLLNLLVFGFVPDAPKYLTGHMGFQLFSLIWFWFLIYKNNWETRPPSPFDLFLFVLTIASSAHCAWVSSGMPIWG